jgi:protein ImuB
MLWLCLSLPQLPASALGLPDAAIADQRGSQRWLITESAGIAAGTAVAAALAVAPDLDVRARNLQAERETLGSLAHWLYHYGSPVVSEQIDLQEPGRRPRARLWVEAGASLKLFGGLRALAANLRAELALLGHRADLALAPTRAGAALLAESARKPIACFDLQSLEQRLSRLPIAALPWPGAILDALKGVGLRKLGELFALPRESFARRFGEARLDDLDRLRGLAAEPFDAITPPPRYARRFELSGDVESIEPLLFPLKRMCAELAAYLRARDSGATAITLVCTHAFGERTHLEFGFLTPTRDAARMFAALNERLFRDPPPRAVREITLEAERFATPQPLQGDLFDALGGRTLDWQQAVERLQARFGDRTLWTPACVAEHRPERAFDQGRPEGGPEIVGRPSGPQRPVWLLKEPQPMSPPRVDSDCERIESGWWDGPDATRDYYCVERAGSRAWVFQERRSGMWFLHGWFG